LTKALSADEEVGGNSLLGEGIVLNQREKPPQFQDSRVEALKNADARKVGRGLDSTLT